MGPISFFMGNQLSQDNSLKNKLKNHILSTVIYNVCIVINQVSIYAQACSEFSSLFHLSICLAVCHSAILIS